MDTLALTLGLSWTLSGLLLMGLAVPLVRGRVGRNRLYGVRFRESLESDEAWLAINRFGGRRLIAWAVPMVVVGVMCLFLPLEAHEGWALVLGFVPLIFVLAPLIEAWRFARGYGAGV